MSVRNFPSELCQHAVHWIPASVAYRDLLKDSGLPLSRSSFYRWLMNGTIPTRRLVTRIFVAREDIAHFAKESYNP